MTNITIDTGTKRITINDDPDRVLEFNPSDVLFAEKFYALLAEFETQMENYRTQIAAAEAVTATDEKGLPINAAARIALVRETCEYVRSKIDFLFGEGTSEMVFGDVLNLDVFTQFFAGIIPFIQEARSEAVKKYAVPKSKAAKKKSKK